MRTKFSGLLTLLLALVVQVSFAQNKTISGNVTDQDGLPLPGVSVVVKGTTNGTQSDFDGNYTIEAAVGQVLEYTYVGQKKVSRTVGASNRINVQMEQDTQALEEVVVTGYGTSTKKAFAGTAATVKAENIEAKALANVSQALAGEVAGVNVINTSGQPGTVATIRIRGFGSVNGNRDPLYVVDGVPYSGSVNAINPADIASTTVLKDATATAIYGSRGANGVILLTTKKGKKGVSNIEVDFKTGTNVSQIPRYDVVKSPEEYIGLSWQALRNKGEFNGEADPVAYANANLFNGGVAIDSKYNMWNVADGAELIDPATGLVRSGVTRKYSPERWEDLGFRDAYRTEANVRISGGGDKSNYYSSFGYLDDQGYLINTDYQRYSTRHSLTNNVADWVKLTTNVGYTYSKSTSNGQSSDSNSIFWFVDNVAPIYPVYLRDANGVIVPDDVFGGNQFDYGDGRGFGPGTNAIGNATYDEDRTRRHELNGNMKLDIDITDYLKFESTFGAQYYSNTREDIQNPIYGFGASTEGSLFKVFTEIAVTDFLNLLRFNKSFGNHGLEALVAYQANRWDYKYSSAYKTRVVNLANDDALGDLNNYVVQGGPNTGYTYTDRLISYIGQVNYNYDQTYFLTASVRSDGSSRFLDEKWGTFGSIGAAWVLSNEQFLNSSNWVDFLKLKASYGLIGDRAGVSRYSGQNGYNIANLNGQISLPVRAIRSRDLSWETSKMFQTGVEFTLFNNVLKGSLDYYIKDTDDLVFDKRISLIKGDALIQLNDGKLRNQGLEFDLTAKIFDKTDFGLDFSINGEFLKNELIDMPVELGTGEQKLLDQNGNYGRSVGSSLFDFYIREWAGVDPDNGDPLWNLYYHDANNNGVVDAGEAISSMLPYQKENPNNAISKTTTNVYSNATEKYVNKSVIPDVRGAFRLALRFKNFRLTSQFAYSLGGHAYDGVYAGLMSNDQVGTDNKHKDILNSWKQPGDVTDVPRLYSGENIQAISASTRFITSTDFLALNNMSLTYSLPQQFLDKLPINGLSFSLTGDNLFLLSKRDGFNPATSETGASNTYRYSPLTTYALGVRVKF